MWEDYRVQCTISLLSVGRMRLLLECLVQQERNIVKRDVVMVCQKVHKQGRV